MASTIFLFGPHVGTFTKSSIDKLVKPLSTSPQRDWILATISDLRTYWDALATKMPDVARDVDGPGSLSALDSWLRYSIDEAELSIQDDENLPSILVGPLVVLVQLTQYWLHLEIIKDGDGAGVVDLQAELVQQARSGEKRTVILGFCAGLLAALSVASAKDQAEFEQYGAVAVRLAMLIGALIDAQEVWDKASGKGSSVSYAVAWRGEKQEKDMNNIINDLSNNAYVAVRYDQMRATITASETISPLLIKRLKAAGITVAEVGIKGQIHSPNSDRRGHTNSLVELCGSLPGLQYADVGDLALTTYDNQGTGQPLSGSENMTEMVVRSILVQQCQWYDTFSAVADAHEDPYVVTFGLERCVPSTLMRSLGGKQVFYEDLPKDSKKPSFWVQQAKAQPQPQRQQQVQKPSPIGPVMPVSPQSEPIAIVGMSVKTAGADDLDEFAAMLKTGQSQHVPITRDRLMHDMLFRENADADPKRQFYGCFFRDGDAFDHKFFKRSPRESAAMDPQSRIVLQAAYQAVEQAGYFSESHAGYTADGRDKLHVGVYLGSCGVDYEHNISCYDPNAFTATGALKSFITGRVSHHFGWTGPCMTFDTACSSSAVAIHTACRNILSGECTAALAGGSNTVTNMNWFQNLAAGSFVSPTGQCKPFDDSADGYCRAEGAAFVYLKRLSDAIQDGNQVIATIDASAVYQNENCTPLFVPNSPSLSHLFKDVMRQANVTANDISLVEAHGTGTPVGDPAEYESILAALGGPGRQKKLPIGSVKGHIGHTEGASGAIALVKIIMMMRDGFIPPQASFKTMNKKIPVKADDNIEVVTRLRSWDEKHKTALLNNYGACGSNASMIITQPHNTQRLAQNDRVVAGARYPFWLPGLDTRAIAAYGAKLGPWLRSCKQEPSLADVSFNLNRQSNRGLPHGFIFNARSLSELHEKLEQASAACSGTKDTTASMGIATVKVERPVILCFGGQISRFVGLDKGLFNSVALLRNHLDAVDNIVKAQGLESIYAAPDIFSREAVTDTVKLQTMLFAMQYACARSWIDCGLEGKIQALVGHSFGEITALCVSGTLTLDDTVRLVAARAKLVRDSWGSDPGAMMAVEGDEEPIRQLLSQANQAAGSDGPASIACYNGPRSFTVAGSTAAVDHVQQAILTPEFKSIKGKRLSVTNAFHSALVDKITDGLESIGETLSFKKPIIPIERATQFPLSQETDASFVSQHMRQPVFFNHAVQRLANRYPEAIFLEAGSNSTITVMAGRAIAQGQASSDGHIFQAVNIANDTGFDSLADATTALWKQGLRVAFWPHHALQAPEYEHLLLPPYQFDTSSRHWLPMKSPLEKVEEKAAEMVAANGGTFSVRQQDTHQDPQTMPLWDFVGYQGDDPRQARFRINTSSDIYNHYVLSHVIAQTAPICPGTLECDIVIEALFSLEPSWKEDSVQPAVRDMINHSPICKDPSRTVYLDLAASNRKRTNWNMKIISVDSTGSSKGSETHAEASIEMRSSSDPTYMREFANFERLVSHKQCTDLLRLNLDQDTDDDVEVLQGRNVYRAFSPIVDYGEVYRGVKYVVGKGNECAGRVQLPRSSHGDTWLNVPLSDSFSQVGGVWVNLMTDLPSTDMFIATGCELSLRSPTAPAREAGDVWHVYAKHSWQGDKALITDLFVFDAATGQLVEIMLGVQYMRVARASMGMMLARMTKDESALRTRTQAPAPSLSSQATKSVPVEVKSSPNPEEKVKSKTPKREKKSTVKKAKISKSKSSKPSGWRDITSEVRDLVATVSGIDSGELELDADMADFGIDSLMGMELGKEVETAFKCTLDQNEQMEATTLRKFVQCVSNALFGPDQGHAEDDVEEEDSDYSSTESDSESNDDSAESSDTGILTPTYTPEEEQPLPLKAVAIHKSTGLSAIAPPSESQLVLSSADVLASFGQVKLNTDTLMKKYGVDKTEGVMLSGSNRLCAALVVEAMDELGFSLRTATEGQLLDRVPFLPQHGRLMQWVYEFLERDAQLINIDPVSGQIVRTHIAPPRKSSDAVFQEVLASDPGFAVPNKLAYYAGRQLAGVLSGSTDGIRVLFGSPEGRELTAAMYCEHTFNCMSYEQMRETTRILAERIGRTGETLKILEMGAGTGGTTLVMAPFLATLAESGALPIEYTFTDISPSMVANARRRFSKLYPFMRFAVHDIEKPPADELKNQHLVLASNAVHATHNLGVSLSNIHQALRSDGFLMMLEMTEVVPFVDLVFGLLEGWWLFDDGRHHAVVPAGHWQRELHKAGFGHVDWTDGNLPENSFQKVIISLASGNQGPLLPKPEPVQTLLPELSPENIETRTANAENLVRKYTASWETPKLRLLDSRAEQSASLQRNGKSLDAVVIVTGATGSLGSHIVQKLAETPSVARVVCLNRRSSSGSSPEKRQHAALTTRGIRLSPGARAKLRILETDTSKPQLGLPPLEYSWLLENTTDIIHNAWPMSGTRPVSAFEPQLQAMRNLLDLAREIACRPLHSPPSRVGFQFISSIGVVGFCGQSQVPEERVPLSATLPSGYGEAKWICERMLDETLHRHPKLFRPMVVRPGQISGSSTSGFWNPVEHFAFLVKSSQSLSAWPALDGQMQWIPVDYCAGGVVDLLHLASRNDEAYPVYHMDNPVGQDWKAMNPVLASALDVPERNIIPFKAWISRVRRSPLPTETENPAARLVDFLDEHFERMSCGGLVLDTSKATEHSSTMAGVGPVEADVARSYITAWKGMGYLA